MASDILVCSQVRVSPALSCKIVGARSFDVKNTTDSTRGFGQNSITEEYSLCSCMYHTVRILQFILK